MKFLDMAFVPRYWDFGYAINSNQSTFDKNFEKLHASYITVYRELQGGLMFCKFMNKNRIH